jgi:BirA family transcriptional regulator, biotin operon repressor / biotin---[acetyl-CoA-carboxylase] ligase
LPDPIFQPRLGSPFIELQSVDSTNNYALARIYAGLAQHGSAFFAHEQVAGKGQRGKTWIAERGNNLILSVVINPQALALSQQFHLSACVAVSVCQLFKGYAGDDTRIKWPNDLYWQDRKAGGILIENIIGGKKMAVGGRQMTVDSQQSAVGSRQSSNWQWAVIGIGININQDTFPPDLKKAVSLTQITGRKFNIIEMAKELCLILDQNFTRLCTTGFEQLYMFYQDHLYKRNEMVRFKKDSRTFEALVKTVTTTGNLIVQHAIEEEFRWGEIEWRS